MHPTIIAERQAMAQKRIMEAAGAVAARWGVEPPTKSEGRYNTVNDMLTWESIAAFVEAVATASPGVKVEEVLAVPGLSKTSIAAIEKHFEVKPALADQQPADTDDQQNISEDQQSISDDGIDGDQRPADTGAATGKKAKK